MRLQEVADDLLGLWDEFSAPRLFKEPQVLLFFFFFFFHHLIRAKTVGAMWQQETVNVLTLCTANFHFPPVTLLHNDMKVCGELSLFSGMTSCHKAQPPFLADLYKLECEIVTELQSNTSTFTLLVSLPSSSFPLHSRCDITGRLGKNDPLWK